MRRIVIIVLLFFGGVFFIASSYYIVLGNLMMQNGIKVIGVIKKMETNYDVEGPSDVIYTLACKYEDSIYISKFNLGESDYKVNDSFAYYFNPKNTDDLIYPLDNHFRIGNYLGFVVGSVLLIIAIIILRK